MSIETEAQKTNIIENVAFVDRFCHITEKGKVIFHRMNIAKYLIDKHNALISKDKYMYVYDDSKGIYNIDYGVILETELNTMFGDNINISETREIMRKIWHYPGVYLNELENLWNNEDFICLRNGVYDIEQHKLVPHDPKYYFLSRIPIDYVENAKCPCIERLMSNVFTDQQVLDEYEWIGYCLTPGNKYKLISIYHGNTDSGKSTYFNLITELLGVQNISVVEPQDFNKEFYIYDLHNKLINIAADVGIHKITGFNKIKKLTGNDIIRANIKNKPMVSFKNPAKMMWGANKIPQTDDDTTASYNRFRQIDLGRVISDYDKKSFNWSEYITNAELSGFLNLAIVGLYRLKNRNGFLLKSLDERINDMDVATMGIFNWADDHIEFTNNKNHKLHNIDLLESWKKWNDENGVIVPINDKAFYKDFNKAFNKKFLSNKNMRIDGKLLKGYEGIRFNAEVVAKEILGFESNGIGDLVNDLGF